MPTSFHSHVSKMVDWIFRIQPTRVLDIGVGHGKWGFLTREYTDIFFNRYHREQWQVTIEGVEAFPEYANPIYAYAYDKVHYGDVTELLPTLPEYDLVIIGDVIEHFPKEAGLRLLAELRKKASFILISSPTFFFQQEIMGNSFETHHSLWTWRDFDGFRFDYEEIDHALFVALLQGERPSQANVRLEGKAASLVYGLPWARRRPKLAQILKKFVSRLPTFQPWAAAS